MRPEHFHPLKPDMVGQLTELAETAQPEQLMALAWWPENRRAVGLAVLGFAAELQAIPGKVSEPMLGQIRFAFWREVLEELVAGRTRAHPVAEALLAVRSSLSDVMIAAMTALVDAAELGLPAETDGPPTDAAAFEASLLPLLVELASQNAAAAEWSALGRFVAEAAPTTETTDFRDLWKALTPLSPALTPLGGATKLTFRRRRGKSVAFSQLSMFLTVLRGR